MKQKLDVYTPAPSGFDLANYAPFADMSAHEWRRELLYRCCLRDAPNIDALKPFTAKLMINPVTLDRPLFGYKRLSFGANASAQEQAVNTVRPLTINNVFNMADDLDNDSEHDGQSIKAPRALKWSNENRKATFDSEMRRRFSHKSRYANVSISLDWSEKKILEDFGKFIKKERADNNISNQNLRVDMPEWHRLRILPCFDLIQWARARDKEWSLDALASLLSTDEQEITAKAVGRTIILRITTVISDRMMGKLV